jgi:hypothetical protein
MIVSNHDDDGSWCSAVRFSIPERNWATEWSYQQILLHAVSKEHDTPNIYCQISSVGPELLTQLAQQQSADEEEGGNEGDELIHEIRFVPPQQQDGGAQLQQIYDAMSRGAAMNPDPRTESFFVVAFAFSVLRLMVPAETLRPEIFVLIVFIDVHSWS